MIKMTSHPFPFISLFVILALAYLAEGVPPRPAIEQIQYVSLPPTQNILDRISYIPTDPLPRRASTAQIFRRRTGSIEAAIPDCTLSAPSEGLLLPPAGDGPSRALPTRCHRSHCSYNILLGRG